MRSGVLPGRPLLETVQFIRIFLQELLPDLILTAVSTASSMRRLSWDNPYYEPAAYVQNICQRFTYLVPTDSITFPATPLYEIPYESGQVGEAYTFFFLL